MKPQIIVALSSATVLVAVFAASSKAQSSSKPISLIPVWEYKTIRQEAVGGGYSRIGRQYSSVGAEATAVLPRQLDLNTMGADGWELVSTNLEMETAFPNFARGDTVEGLKSNVRPQALIMMFKRQSTPEALKMRIEADRKALVAEIEAERKSKLLEIEAARKALLPKPKVIDPPKSGGNPDDIANYAESISNVEFVRANKGELDKILKEGADHANVAIWEKRKAEAVLDSVVLASDSKNRVIVLAVGPESKLKRLAVINRIKLRTESSFTRLYSIEQLSTFLKTNQGKALDIRWHFNGLTYDSTIEPK